MTWTTEAWPELKAAKPELCFSMAQSHPGNAGDFHAGCDGNKHTITVAKSENGNIFGGVTDVDWSGAAGTASDKTFIYCISCARSLTDADGNPIPVQMKVAKPEFAVSPWDQGGPGFGSGLSIGNTPGTGRRSESRLGYEYKCPKDADGLGLDADGNNYMCGDADCSYCSCPSYLDSKGDRCTELMFKIADYEVYILK